MTLPRTPTVLRTNKALFPPIVRLVDIVIDKTPLGTGVPIALVFVGIGVVVVVGVGVGVVPGVGVVVGVVPGVVVGVVIPILPILILHVALPIAMPNPPTPNLLKTRSPHIKSTNTPIYTNRTTLRTTKPVNHSTDHYVNGSLPLNRSP